MRFENVIMAFRDFFVQALRVLCMHGTWENAGAWTVMWLQIV